MGDGSDETNRTYRSLYMLKTSDFKINQLKPEYSAFRTEQQLTDNDVDYKQQLAYWKTQLNNLHPLELPTDYPRTPLIPFDGDSIYFRVSPESTSALKKFSQVHGATLFSALLTLFGVLLRKYSNQPDIAIGIPSYNKLDCTLTKFIYPLVIRQDFSTNPMLVDALKMTMHTLLNAQANSNLSFNKIIDQLQSENFITSLATQIMFVFKGKKSDKTELSNLITQQLQIKNDFTNFELVCFLKEKNEFLEGSIEYNAALFSRETIQRFIDNFLFITEELPNKSLQSINQFSVLSNPEKQKLIIGWNCTKKDYPKNKNLIQLFEEQVKKAPHNIAIIHEEQTLTYIELNNKANQLAHFIKKSGIDSGSYIALYFERSIETIISFLAILKSGNAYIPMDKEAPLILMEKITDDAKVSMTITKSTFSIKARKLAARVQAQVIILDEQAHLINQESIDNLESFSPTDLAYVIYTSGSTGEPKGVKISHKSLVNLMFSMREELEFTAQDILLAITPLTFDLSVPDVYLPLTMGASFVLETEATRFNPHQIMHSIRKHKITIMQATPTTWQMLANCDWKNETSIKIICGGEALTTQLASQLNATSSSFWNFYGPTETTVWSSCHKILSVDTSRPCLSVGKPLANTQLYVLDASLQPTPIGVPGELYIAGDGVGEGYLNNTLLTQERFIDNPFSIDTRKKLYRTGDIVLWSASGELHYIGREDNQIKIRGFRIETATIEKVLSKYPEIQNAIVLDKSPSKEHELVAYITSNKNALSLASILDFLKSNLPEFMIPTKFVVVSKFPLTANGKIDRKNIPNIKEFGYLTINNASKNIFPQNKYEIIIVDILKKLLKVEPINIDANFIDLGVHSFLLVELANALNQELKKNIQITDLFSYSTVKLLASFLNEEVTQKIKSASFDEIQQRTDLKKNRILKRRISHAN